MWYNVNEEVIKRFSYDTLNQVLMIEFQHGYTCHYMGVPATIVENLNRVKKKDFYFKKFISCEYYCPEQEPVQKPHSQHEEDIYIEVGSH